MNNDRAVIEMSKFKDFAVAIAFEAGQLLKSRIDEPHEIEFKGEIDIVTEADKASENLLIARIRDRYPNHDVMSEEAGNLSRPSSYRWIIDPLDGTTNYSHGYPVFCVSIALECEQEIVTGVVYNPMLDEMFTAEKGGGAFLGNRKISVSGIANLSKSLLATGFPYDIRNTEDNNMNFFGAMAVSAQAIRRAGAAALDLAYLAAGRFDGFWELRLKPWDVAAAWLLVCEAGGTVTDLFGEPYRLGGPHILASNGLIHSDIIAVLKKA